MSVSRVVWLLAHNRTEQRRAKQETCGGRCVASRSHAVAHALLTCPGRLLFPVRGRTEVCGVQLLRLMKTFGLNPTSSGEDVVRRLCIKAKDSRRANVRNTSRRVRFRTSRETRRTLPTRLQGPGQTHRQKQQNCEYHKKRAAELEETS